MNQEKKDVPLNEEKDKRVIMDDEVEKNTPRKEKDIKFYDEEKRFFSPSMNSLDSEKYKKISKDEDDERIEIEEMNLNDDEENEEVNSKRIRRVFGLRIKEEFAKFVFDDYIHHNK